MAHSSFNVAMSTLERQDWGKKNVVRAIVISTACHSQLEKPALISGSCSIRYSCCWVHRRALGPDLQNTLRFFIRLSEVCRRSTYDSDLKRAKISLGYIVI